MEGPLPGRAPNFLTKDCQGLHSTNLPALRFILRQGSRQIPPPPLPTPPGRLGTALARGATAKGWKRLSAGAAARTCGTVTSSTAPATPRPGSSENRKRWARTSYSRRLRLPRGESGTPGRAGNCEERRAARLRAGNPKPAEAT